VLYLSVDAQAGAKPMSGAERLLQDTLATYQGLSSYQDEGFVLILGKGQERLHRTEFETQFLRPSFFHFRFESPHPHAPLSHVTSTSICGSDGARAYLWTMHYDAPPKVHEYETVVLAVAAATGISSGSAHTIAQLLLEGFNEPTILSPADPVLGGDELVEGVQCKVVSGQLPGTEIGIALFIDAGTMTIRKLRTEFAAFTSDEVRLNIRLNEPIEESVFSWPEGET
jgi:hypothetical protein